MSQRTTADDIMPPAGERSRGAEVIVCPAPIESKQTTPVHVIIDEAEWAPPDGGYGWVIMMTSFSLNVMFACMAQTGLFLIEWQEYFQISVSQVSWLNTFHTVFGRLLGIFIGPLIGRFGCRWMVLVGALLMAGSHVMTSFAPNLSVMYLSYGAIQSTGMCIYFSAAIVCVQQYFDKKRSIAVGISCSGVNVGFFIWPPFAAWLLQKFGWQRTLQIEAILQLCVGIVCSGLLRPPSVRPGQGKCIQSAQDLQPSKSSLEEQHSQAKDLQPSKSSLEDQHSQAKETNIFNIDVSISERSAKQDSGPDANKVSLCSKIRRRIPIDSAPLHYISWWMFMGYVALNTCNYACTTFFSPLRSEMLGLTTEQGALQLSLLGILSTVFTPIYAFLGNHDKVNRRLVVGLGTIIAGICSVLSTSFTTQTQLLLYATLFGISQATVFGCDYSVIVDIVGVKNVAAGGGWFVVAMGMGHVIVQPSTGWIVDMTGNTKLIFILFGILGAAGGLLVSLSVLVQRKVDKSNYPMDPNCSSTDLVAMSDSDKIRLVAVETGTAFRVI